MLDPIHLKKGHTESVGGRSIHEDEGEDTESHPGADPSYEAGGHGIGSKRRHKSPLNSEFASTRRRRSLRLAVGGNKHHASFEDRKMMGVLKVFIAHCRGLRAMDVTGSSDPYVEVSTGIQTLPNNNYCLSYFSLSLHIFSEEPKHQVYILVTPKPEN